MLVVVQRELEQMDRLVACPDGIGAVAAEVKGGMLHVGFRRLERVDGLADLGMTFRGLGRGEPGDEGEAAHGGGGKRGATRNVHVVLLRIGSV